jgi:hypothetical protein
MSILSGFFSLSSEVNKAKAGGSEETTEGVVSSLTPELTLDIKDEELIALKKQWLLDWGNYEKEIKSKQDENEEYWLGKQFPGVQAKANDRPLVDNVIFESTETFLPNATKQNPEPMVECEDEELGKAVQQKLADLADSQRMKLHLKKAARHWLLYLLGAIKVAYDPDTNEPSLVTVRPQRLILEPESTIDEHMEYTGSYLGEYRDAPAYKLIKLYPAKKKYITDKVQGKLGTKLRYIEWWTPDYVFWTLDNEVLAKAQNPHWNYEMRESVDELGNVTPQAPLNHFPVPKIPYAFLSVFNLGKHPHDDTSLISQNLAQQDLINKRHRQIDKNADNMNNGLVISLAKAGLNKEEAAQVAEAWRRGGAAVIPDGIPREAIDVLQGTSLPTDIFAQQVDTRTRILDVFGVRGSTAQGIMSEKTVRGKILTKASDGDRNTFVAVANHLSRYSFNVPLCSNGSVPSLSSRRQPATTFLASVLLSTCFHFSRLLPFESV